MIIYGAFGKNKSHKAIKSIEQIEYLFFEKYTIIESNNGTKAKIKFQPKNKKNLSRVSITRTSESKQQKTKGIKITTNKSRFGFSQSKKLSIAY